MPDYLSNANVLQLKGRDVLTEPLYQGMKGRKNRGCFCSKGSR